MESRRRVFLAVAFALVALAFVVVVGTLDSIERHRLLGRAARALEGRDLAELERVEAELDRLFETRRDRLPPRRDGILNELGAARERVQREIARLRAEPAAVRSSSPSR